MPELPESERLALDLQTHWVGKSIVSVTPLGKTPLDVFFRTLHVLTPSLELLDRVLGVPIVHIIRYGKVLQLAVQPRTAMWFHLGSTGWLAPTKYDLSLLYTGGCNFLHPTTPSTARLLFTLSDGSEWTYYDKRCLGRFYLVTGWKRELYHGKIGYDWLLEPEAAQMALHAYTGNRVIKVVLCNQAVAAGVGNYIACEACFNAGIHPHERWKTLHPYQIQALAEAVIAVIDRGLQEHAGPDDFRVFGRRDQPCPRCTSLTESIFHRIQYALDPGNQRGSYFCPICQGKSKTFRLKVRLTPEECVE